MILVLSTIAPLLIGNLGRAQSQSPPQYPSDQLPGNNQPNPPNEVDPEGGDPVSLLTGDYQLQETDLSIAGRGMDFEFTRFYRSRTVLSSTLGTHWNFNWNQFIVLEYGHISQPPGGDGPVWELETDGGVPPMGVTGAYYYNGSNRIDAFYPNSSQPNAWNSPPGYFAKLRHEGDLLSNPTAFILRSADGKILTFDVRDWNDHLNDPFVLGVVFRLSKIEDRAGNTINIDYENSIGPNPYSRINKIRDTYNREINFEYVQSGPHTNLLSYIEDFTGRRVTFTHDNYISGSGNYYNLTDVRTPFVEGTPTGNDFTEGKTTHYEYDIANPAHRYDLTKIYAAQEWQNGNGPTPVPYLHNTYDSQSRVVNQFYGGTNANNIPAGGQFNFRYDNTARFWPPSFTEVSRTFVVDPNGNVELHLFDVQDSDRVTYQFTGRLNPADVPTSIPVSITAGSPDPSNSLVSPPQSNLRPSDPGCFFTKRTFNTDGLVVDEAGPSTHFEYTYASSTTDVFQRGNLIRVKQFSVPDNGKSLITINAYEPIFNRVRASVDPRGNDSAYVPPNGGTTSPQRYQTTHYVDYQEAASAPASMQSLITAWGIDVTQASQATLFPHLPPLFSGSTQDLNGDGLTNQTFGNVIKTELPVANVFTDPVNSGTSFTSQSAMVLTAYNSFSLPRWVKDPEDNTTSFLYNHLNDPTGQGVPNESDLNGGFLDTTSEPQAVSTRLEYDALGRVTIATNGRGFKTEITYNALDEVVELHDVGVSGQDAISMGRRFIYDWNGNVVEEDVKNRVPTFQNGLPNGADQDGTSGPWIVHRRKYDIMNHCIESDMQASGSVRLVTRYRYDRLGNGVLTLLPESMSGGLLVSPNLVARVFDERNLPWQTTRGGLSTEFRSLAASADVMTHTIGSLADSALESTATIDYDLAGRATRSTDGENHVSLIVYDPLERPIRTEDAVGNWSLVDLDPAGNLVRRAHYDPPPGGNQDPLSESFYRHDERGRVYEVEQTLRSMDQSISVPDGSTTLTPGNGRVTRRAKFDKNGRMILSVNDSKSTVSYQYDDRNRVTIATDVLGNSTTYSYDKNDNAIKIDEYELDSTGTVGTHYFTRRFYDKFDRLKAVRDPIGHTVRYLYDSRGSTVFESDALNSNVSVSADTLDT